jgi:uncharacterized protein (TIGR02444 family)
MPIDEPGVTPSVLDGPHWAFALRLYGQPGVAEACLLLQDRLGVDVNVLLLSAYAAVERGIALDARDLQEMDGLVAPWRGEVVTAVRRIRRRLKSGPPPAPGKVTERLRAHIKRAELDAEQIEQAVLADWLDRRCAGRQPSPVDIRHVLQTVVAHFAAAAGAAPDADIRDAMQTILAAATRGT